MRAVQQRIWSVNLENRKHPGHICNEVGSPSIMVVQNYRSIAIQALQRSGSALQILVVENLRGYPPRSADRLARVPIRFVECYTARDCDHRAILSAKRSPESRVSVLGDHQPKCRLVDYKALCILSKAEPLGGAVQRARVLWSKI